MKIMIHALGADMGGAVRHLANLLPELGKVDPNNEYVILIRKSLPEIKVAENIRFRRVQDKMGSSWKSRTIGDLVQLPMSLKKEGFNALVSLMNFGPIWTPVPHILFQCSSLFYCKYYLNDIRGKLKFEIHMRRRWVVESMKRADVIVTPTHAMGEMIKETCPVVKNKNFKTIYHGFSLQSLNSTPDENLLKALSFSGHKLLYPTHPARHKGFEVLFKTLFNLKKQLKNFALFIPISREDCPELIKKYEETISDLKLQDNVVFLGRVPQAQMGCLYQKCDLMVYPSLCESFGFSMIEALGYGTPIVAAQTRINEEICREAAYYYSPLDPEDGANKILLALEKEAGNKLRQKAKVRLQSYDWGWNRCAREFVNLVKEIGV